MDAVPNWLVTTSTGDISFQKAPVVPRPDSVPAGNGNTLNLKAASPLNSKASLPINVYITDREPDVYDPLFPAAFVLAQPQSAEEEDAVMLPEGGWTSPFVSNARNTELEYAVTTVDGDGVDWMTLVVEAVDSDVKACRDACIARLTCDRGDNDECEGGSSCKDERGEISKFAPQQEKSGQCDRTCKWCSDPADEDAAPVDGRRTTIKVEATVPAGMLAGTYTYLLSGTTNYKNSGGDPIVETATQEFTVDIRTPCPNAGEVQWVKVGFGKNCGFHHDAAHYWNVQVDASVGGASPTTVFSTGDGYGVWVLGLNFCQIPRLLSSSQHACVVQNDTSFEQSLPYHCLRVSHRNTEGMDPLLTTRTTSPLMTRPARRIFNCPSVLW
jgi:hypothetical protein